MRKFTTMITVKDGRVHIPNKAEMNEFFRLVKDGTRAIMEIELCDPDASTVAKAYFNHVIVPAFQRGFKALGDPMSEFQVKVFILGECPYVTTIKFDQIGKQELSNAIDWCKQYAAENLGVCIEDTGFIKNTIK